MLCRRKTGNKNSFTCPFHGWTFSNNGKLLKAKDESTGGYHNDFKQDGSHDLQKIAAFSSLTAVSYSVASKADVLQPLEALSRKTTKIIDLIVDQAPEGSEVLKGSSSYVYEEQLETGRGKRRRWLSRQRGPLELRLNRCHAATMKRKGRTQWMPVGQKASAAAMDLITAICCCGPGRSTRKCARSSPPPRTAAGGIWRTPCRPDGQRNPQPVTCTPMST